MMYRSFTIARTTARKYVGTALRPLTSSTTRKPDLERMSSMRPFRDISILSSGLDVPDAASCYCAVNDNHSAVAHFVVDCRNANNTISDSPHRFSHPQGEEEDIVSVMVRVLGVDAERARFLINLGAVYMSAFPHSYMVDPSTKVCKNMPTSQLEVAQKNRSYFENYIRASTHGLDAPIRVSDDTLVMKTGNYLRVRLHPRRNPFAIAMKPDDWRNRILYEDDGLIVIDKPAGVPTVPVVDNAVENVAVSVGQMLGYKYTELQPYPSCIFPRAHASARQTVLPYIPGIASKGANAAGTKNDMVIQEEEETRPFFLVYILHRLDIGTSGCILLGKTKAMSETFRQLFESRNSIRKFYKVFCFSFTNPDSLVSPVPLGLHTHHLQLRTCCPIVGGHPNVRTRAFDEPAPSRKEAELVVLSAEPVNLGVESPVQLWEMEVELKSGRTHQIRAQFEKFGVCVVGDEVYPRLLWDVQSILDGRIGLQASRLELCGLGSKNETKVFTPGDAWWKTDAPQEVCDMVTVQVDALKASGMLGQAVEW